MSSGGSCERRQGSNSTRRTCRPSVVEKSVPSPTAADRTSDRWRAARVVQCTCRRGARGAHGEKNGGWWPCHKLSEGISQNSAPFKNVVLAIGQEWSNMSNKLQRSYNSLTSWQIPCFQPDLPIPSASQPIEHELFHCIPWLHQALRFFKPKGCPPKVDAPGSPTPTLCRSGSLLHDSVGGGLAVVQHLW